MRKTFPNIGFQKEFDIEDNIKALPIPYDYASIMHFQSRTYSIANQRTIVPVNDSIPLAYLGSSQLPTQQDYLHIYLLYCQGKGFAKYSEVDSHMRMQQSFFCC